MIIKPGPAPGFLFLPFHTRAPLVIPILSTRLSPPTVAKSIMVYLVTTIRPQAPLVENYKLLLQS